MVESGKSFLARQRRLKAAAEKANIPGAQDTEEQITTDVSVEEEKKPWTQRTAETITQSNIGQKLIGFADTLGDTEGLKQKIGSAVNKIGGKIVESDVGQGLVKAAEYIPQTEMAQMITEAQTAPSAQDIEEASQKAIEGVDSTKEAREALFGDDPEFKKKYSFRRGAAKLASSKWLNRTPGAKDFVQTWNDTEKNIYLSDGTIVIKEPELEIPNGLDNAKNLAASVTYAYITKGKMVDAKTVKESMPGFEDVSDDTLNKFIGGILYSYIHKQEIDRDKVAEIYGDIVKSDEYISKKQATIDLLMNPETWTYGLDQSLNDAIESDPELMKAIEAYTTIGQYGDFLSNNGYNKYGSSARGLAQSYQDEGFESEGGMSLKEAYTIASQYDDEKINNLLMALTNNLQNAEKYATREYSRVTKRPREQNTAKFFKDIGSVSKALLQDFAEFNVEGWSESGLARATPLGVADLFISGRTFTDGDGNIRNRSGKVVFERHSDGTYTNNKGENVTEMLRTQQGFIKSFANHLDGLLEGFGGTLEGASKMSSVREDEGFAKSLEYSLPVVAGMFDTYFNASMLMSPKILALESTPLTSEGMGLFFSGVADLGANITEGVLEMLNLADSMDPENVEAAKQLGSTFTTIMVMNKVGKTLDPYKKSFIEAKDKVFNKYRDRIVQMMGKDELNSKIKKERLTDKTKEETIIDGEKTVEEIKGERMQEKSTKKTETKQEVVKQTPAEKVEIKEPTQREEIDITPTKDKLGYAFQVNRAVIADMVKEFKQEFQKSLNKNLPENSIGRALYDMSQSDVSFREQAQKTFKDIGLTAKDIVTNAAAGIKELWNRVSTKRTSKRQEDAYDKMKFSTEEKETMRNNSKRGKLGQILQNLISTKKGKIVKDKNVTGSQVAKMVKDSVAKDRVKEQLQRGRDRLQQWKKIIQSDFYQKLSSIKNINFGRFFTGENGIKRALKELFRGDTDAETYIRFREVGGKIIMEYRKGYSVYFDEYVAPELKKLVKEYNDMVENGKVSEQNISKINDSIKTLRKKGEGMMKSQDPLTRDQGKAILNAASNLNRALKEFLAEENVANKLLVGEKASEAIHDMEEIFKNLTKDGKIDENKARSFLENLSEEDIQTLESLGIETREYIDLIKNGSTALEKIFNFELSLKEYKSKVGEVLSKIGKVKSTARGKAGTLTAVVLGGVAAKILGALGLFAIFTSPIDKALGKLADKNYQKNLKKALEKALRNPQNKKQLENILEGLNDTIEEIDAKISKVIEQWTKESTEQEAPKTEKAETETEEGPNRKEYDTSHPNREEYDPNNPIFRNGEDKQQPSEQRDNDMVVSDQESLPGADKKELPDNRQYLGLVEDPEQELDRAMNDIETQVKDALRQLTEMISDNDDDVPPTGPIGPDDTTPPEEPKDGGDDTSIDDFIKIIEGDAPKQGEGKPNFKNRSNESLNKLFDKNGEFKEGVPEEYRQEVLDELNKREVKKQTDDSEVRTQNNIIRAILKQLDQIAEGKAEDNIREKYNEQVMQAWNVDTNRADTIIGDIVDGRITESDVYQDKTSYESNQQASEWIKKWTGKETKTTKSASKTSSLEVWDTKPDSQGKLNALKTQLATKKKAKPTKKRQEEINKLEKEIARLEEKLNNRELDDMDVEAQKAIDESMTEELSQKEKETEELLTDWSRSKNNEEKQQVQPSEEKISEPQEEQMNEMSTLMTFNPENATAEEIKKTQIALTKKKNEGDLGIYKKNEVDRKINELNDARIEKENDGKKEKLDYDYSKYDDRYQLQVYKGHRGYDIKDTPGAGEDVEFYTNNQDRALTYAKKGVTQSNIQSEMFWVKTKDTKVIDSKGISWNQYVDDNGNVVEGKTAKNGPHNYINYNNKIAKEEGKKVVIYKDITDIGPFKPKGELDLGGDDIVVLDKNILTEF